MSYYVFGGEEKEWLVAFYGYGQSAKVYEPLYELIKDTHNILVIDNPMQDPETSISVSNFMNWIEELFQQFNISSFQSLSYSMGSRINLFLPLHFGIRHKKMVLVAPDGFQSLALNKLATRTILGNKLFKFFVFKEGAYLGLIRLLNKLRFVNNALYLFMKWTMRDLQQRQNVYHAWMNLRCFFPSLPKVSEACAQHNIQVASFFGKKDAVIRLNAFNQCKKIFPSGKHTLLDTDHHLLKGDFFSLLVQEFR